MKHKKIYIVATIVILSVSSFFIPKTVGNKMLSSDATTSSLLNNYNFGYIFQNGTYQTYVGTSWTGGDKGHVNQLYYNFMIDGYGGLPMGSCLQRSMFITNPAEKAKCTPVENSDLFRSDNSSGSPAKNLLIKNVTIKNAFRTGNAWGGTATINGTPVANPYTSPTQLPHVDTFQSYMGVAKKSIWDDVNKKWIQVDDVELNNKPEWMVIQDTVIKNSDNGAMIVGGTWWDGIVYQNLTTFCEPAFATDALARMNNDKNNFVGSSIGGPAPCGNEIGAETFGQSPVWLINVSSGKSVTINNPSKALAGPVIVVGNNTIAGVGVNKNSTQAIKEGNILSQYYTNGSWSTPSAHPNVKYYDYIEDALAAGNNRPPYLELSCSGWRNPPAGCETRQGYLNDNTPPPTTSALNVTTSGTGTVTSSPAGINCGTDCSETYTIANNTSVTLTANPQAGSTVTWSGACSGSGLTCGPLLMTSGKNITATFSGPTLSFAVGNRITVQSSTANVRALPSLQGFLRGTQAQGANGIILDGPRQVDNITWWYVNYDTGVDGWVGQDTHAVTAENVATPGTQYTLTNNGTNGVITGNLGTYRQGVVAYLTATPNTGYEFVNWTGCTTGTGNICEVSMNSNKTVQAQFQQIPETRVCRPWN